VRPDALERLEADQPVAGPHVEQRRPLERLSLGEHAVAHAGEVLERDRALALAAGIAAFEEPS